MPRYSVKKVDSEGRSIKNFKVWREKHPDELYHDSKLEYEFYHELKRRGLQFEYQNTYCLQPAFRFTDYVKRKRDGEVKSGWYECRIQSITWTPDFVLTDYNLVVEAKGRANEMFAPKLKMFKYMVVQEQLGLKVIVLYSLRELQDFLDKGLPKDGE